MYQQSSFDWAIMFGIMQKWLYLLKVAGKIVSPPPSVSEKANEKCDIFLSAFFLCKLWYSGTEKEAK